MGYGPIGELTFALATQTGATFHVKLALTNDPNPYVDPIAGLPMDLCWGHPVHMQYHYHGYSWKCFPNQSNANEHSPQFGITLDGFGVFGPCGDGGVLLTEIGVFSSNGDPSPPPSPASVPGPVPFLGALAALG